MAKPKSLRPRKKVAAAGASGALATALVAIAAWAGVDVPPEVAAAFCTVASFAAGYFRSEAA